MGGLNMRRLRYSVAMSLDGYIAGPKGEYDWIISDPTIDFGELFKDFDFMVMGRKSFELVRSHGSEGPSFNMGMAVFSRTLKAADYPDVTIISENPALAIGELKNRPGKDIWLFGGGILFRSLLDLHVVDTVELGVIPILLGGGIPLLPQGEMRHSLRLTSCKPYPSGIVMMAYDVVNPS
jgi:dihydrofolate reductase